MDRGAWWATVHGDSKELDTTEQLSMHTRIMKMQQVLKEAKKSPNLSPRKNYWVAPLLTVFSLWGSDWGREGGSEGRSVVSDSLQPHGLYSPWDSPGQNTGVGSLSLLEEIFPTQGSNPGLPLCRQILYQLSHQGSPFSVLFCLFFNILV